jgi:hypothetical protein
MNNDFMLVYIVIPNGSMNTNKNIPILYEITFKLFSLYSTEQLT